MDSQLKINDQLTINYQSDFHLLDEEEKRTMPLTGGGPVEVLRDQERHMIVSIGCKKIPGLASMLFNQNDKESNLMIWHELLDSARF